MPKSTTAGPRDRPRRRRWARRIGIVAGVGAAATLALWVAVHEVPGLGPAVADGLRSVVGPRPVAWLEDVANGAQDRFNRRRNRDAAPKTFWEATPPSVASSTSAATTPPPEVEDEPASPSWSPPSFRAPHEGVATPADGVWVPITDPALPGAPVAMYKSMVHPDPRRSFAALAVVAIDTSAFALHLVAGTKEPFSPRVRRADRPGTVPADHVPLVPAAFNGGFKATHGHYGMLLGGVTYLPPRGFACTFARYRDPHRYRIATFSELEADVEKLLYYRQTPPCLVEDGEVHQQLRYSEYAKGWGATVSGDTVIRRSSIGLSRDGSILYYGLGEAMTAQSLARGMRVAGAHAAAELDVNHSYPKFLFYGLPTAAGEAPRVTHAIIPGIDYYDDLYVTRPSTRDFFYLTRTARREALPLPVAPAPEAAPQEDPVAAKE
ncbi:MAG: hypothetical protein AAF928_12715 [Myxococcota bacterium]